MEIEWIECCGGFDWNAPNGVITKKLPDWVDEELGEGDAVDIWYMKHPETGEEITVSEISGAYQNAGPFWTLGTWTETQVCKNIVDTLRKDRKKK